MLEWVRELQGFFWQFLIQPLTPQPFFGERRELLKRTRELSEGAGGGAPRLFSAASHPTLTTQPFFGKRRELLKTGTGIVGMGTGASRLFDNAPLNAKPFFGRSRIRWPGRGSFLKTLFWGGLAFCEYLTGFLRRERHPKRRLIVVRSAVGTFTRLAHHFCAGGSWQIPHISPYQKSNWPNIKSE